MRIGDVLLSKEVKACGFHPKDMKATFKSKPGSLLVTMYLGSVTPESLPHYSADGAIMALGYGPIAITRVQMGLVQALRATEAHLDDATPVAVRNQVAEALAFADNFTKSAGPLVDLITEDAARFKFAMACALEPEGPAALLAHQVGDEMQAAEEAAVPEGETYTPAEMTQERFVAIIDEARRRWGTPHG